MLLDIGAETFEGVRVRLADVMCTESLVRHDAARTARALLDLTVELLEDAGPL